MPRQVPLSGMGRLWERMCREAAAALAAKAAAAAEARVVEPVVEASAPARPKRVRAARKPCATGPEKPGVLSTEAGIPAAATNRTAAQKPAQIIPENIIGSVRSSEGKRGTGQSSSLLTQHGATTPGSRSGGGEAPAGNVAKSQLGQIGHLVEHPSDVPTDPVLISAATIVSPEINTPAPGAWPIAALRQGQCRFACTPDTVPPADHRFCGARTRVGPGNLHGSWCPEHLARMFERSSRLARPAFLKGVRGVR